MKNLISIVVILAFAFCICSCGSKSEEKVNRSSSTNKNVAVDGSFVSTGSKSSKDDSSELEEDYKDVDYDIAALSTTMAYSQVNEMIQNSSEYLGKTVKIKGTFLAEETEQRNYYLCQISDPTACCSAGFEFVLKNTDLKYPDDYPKQNDEITVTGKFHTYNEGSYVYYELIDAVMTK